MTPSLKTRLEGLAAFLPEFRRSDLQFGHWEGGGKDPKDGALMLPYYVLGPTAEAFVRAAGDLGWVSPEADWTVWRQSEAGLRLLGDNSAVARATADDLMRILTVCVRSDRFCEGSLGAAHASGLLLAVLERAAALLGEVPGANPAADPSAASGKGTP